MAPGCPAWPLPARGSWADCLQKQQSLPPPGLAGALGLEKYEARPPRKQTSNSLLDGYILLNGIGWGLVVHVKPGVEEMQISPARTRFCAWDVTQIDQLRRRHGSFPRGPSTRAAAFGINFQPPPLHQSTPGRCLSCIYLCFRISPREWNLVHHCRKGVSETTVPAVPVPVRLGGLPGQLPAAPSPPEFVWMACCASDAAPSVFSRGFPVLCPRILLGSNPPATPSLLSFPLHGALLWCPPPRPVHIDRASVLVTRL